MYVDSHLLWEDMTRLQGIETFVIDAFPGCFVGWEDMTRLQGIETSLTYRK